jgi:hypothetical protein
MVDVFRTALGELGAYPARDKIAALTMIAGDCGSDAALAGSVLQVTEELIMTVRVASTLLSPFAHAAPRRLCCPLLSGASFLQIAHILRIRLHP